MSKNSKNSHTGFRNNAMFCFNCGASETLLLPSPVDTATATMRIFIKHHKSCKKTWHEPANNPEGKTETENARWWMENGEHGTSSKTMFNVLSDDLYIENRHQSHPSDPDDFRRCYKLLQEVPQFRLKLGRMSQKTKVWGNLIENWDALEGMLIEQMETKEANGMYEFMKKLGC